MSQRQNAIRIDPAVWESHRTEIRNYYLLENKSLVDLVSYMKEKNNFYATWAFNNLLLNCSKWLTVP